MFGSCATSLLFCFSEQILSLFVVGFFGGFLMAAILVEIELCARVLVGFCNRICVFQAETVAVVSVRWGFLHL